MRSGPLSLVFGLLSLSTLGVYANKDQCTSGKYNLLVSSLSQDRYGRDYCASLPPSHRLDRSKCPAALKNYKYEEIKTVCSCVNEKCKKPKCYRPETCCAKACGGYCSDLSKDSKNCGTCGHKCSDGKKCISGKCKTPQPACGYGQELCKGVCKDKTTYQTDKDNCGKCGTKCTDGQTCTAGKCVTPPTPEPECVDSSDCEGGLICRSGTCVINVQVPSFNCRQNSDCKSFENCDFGNCRPKRCGTGTTTPTCPGGSFCNEFNRCQANPPECDDGQELCYEVCTDTTTYQTDRSNCGECGNACADGEFCTNGVCTVCQNSDCTIPVKIPIVITCKWTGCPAWQTCGGQKCMPKSCASGTDCPAGSPCVSGGCQAPPSA